MRPLAIIVSSCSKLAQKEFKRRHDNVARAIHWDLSGKCGFGRNEGGMTMFQTGCLKMTITNFYGTSAAYTT